jgi:hypothetical protein
MEDVKGVFKSRQQEIEQLSTNFAHLLDEMVVDRPLSLDSSGEEEEEPADQPPDDDHTLTITERGLLLLNEIDSMRRETHQLVLWFHSAVVRANPRLANLKSGIQDLYSFFGSLRIRAEKLLSIEPGNGTGGRLAEKHR